MGLRCTEISGAGEAEGAPNFRWRETALFSVEARVDEADFCTFSKLISALDSGIAV
jgi:hypothetical protein